MKNIMFSKNLKKDLHHLPGCHHYAYLKHTGYPIPISVNSDMNGCKLVTGNDLRQLRHFMLIFD